MCVQDFDVQCVLQFTLVNAAGCALHRHASLVIHRIEWSFVFHLDKRTQESAHSSHHSLHSSEVSGTQLGYYGQPPKWLFKPRHAIAAPLQTASADRYPTFDLHEQIWDARAIAECEHDSLSRCKGTRNSPTLTLQPKFDRPPRRMHRVCQPTRIPRQQASPCCSRPRPVHARTSCFSRRTGRLEFR